MSNSKLTSLEKAELKDFKAENQEISFFSFPELAVTVGIRKTGHNMAEFAISIASDTETKFRRKVGEFKVAERFHIGAFLPVRVYGDLEETALNIAESV